MATSQGYAGHGSPSGRRQPYPSFHGLLSTPAALFFIFKITTWHNKICIFTWIPIHVKLLMCVMHHRPVLLSWTGRLQPTRPTAEAKEQEAKRVYLFRDGPTNIRTTVMSLNSRPAATNISNNSEKYSHFNTIPGWRYCYFLAGNQLYEL